MTEQFKLPFKEGGNIMKQEKKELKKSFRTSKSEGGVLIDLDFIALGRKRGKSLQNDGTDLNQPFVGSDNVQKKDVWGYWGENPLNPEQVIACHFSEVTNNLIAKMENPNFEGFDLADGLPVINGEDLALKTEQFAQQSPEKSDQTNEKIENKSIHWIDNKKIYPPDPDSQYRGPFE